MIHWPSHWGACLWTQSLVSCPFVWLALWSGNWTSSVHLLFFTSLVSSKQICHGFSPKYIRIYLYAGLGLEVTSLDKCPKASGNWLGFDCPCWQPFTSSIWNQWFSWYPRGLRGLMMTYTFCWGMMKPPGVCSTLQIFFQKKLSATCSNWKSYIYIYFWVKNAVLSKYYRQMWKKEMAWSFVWNWTAVVPGRQGPGSAGRWCISFRMCDVLSTWVVIITIGTSVIRHPIFWTAAGF